MIDITKQLFKKPKCIKFTVINEFLTTWFLFQDVISLTLQNLVIMFNCGMALATGTSVLQYQYILRKKVKQEEEAVKTLQDHE